MGKSKFHKNEILAEEKGYVILKNGIVNGPVKKDIGSVHQGYRMFKIRVNGSLKNVMIHRYQAYHKFGEKIYEKGMVVRHLNGDSLDNSYSNIGIGTESDNFMDIPKDERVRRARHASSFVTKYKHDDVIEFYNKCRSYKKTMEEFGITSKGTLNFILKKNPKNHKEHESIV